MSGQFRKVAAAAFLLCVGWALTVSADNVIENHDSMHHESIIVQTGETSASLTFSRPAGGITQIGIERLDLFSNSYATIVTASGPTREDAAMAVAVLKTFTKLDQQISFVDTNSIILAYNQKKPGYVISELERAKLISAVEAQAARAAFDNLQSRMDPSGRQH